MFYNQPLAARFGTELLREVDPVIEPFWDRLDIAVAWVRASGIEYLSAAFAKFLRHGGHLSIIVGIDLKNTTREGLQALLDLEQHGKCETFVYHNEAGSTFHPKMFLFRNVREARLIVGSNNLTRSGLYTNVEAGLKIDTTAKAKVVRQAQDALSSWKDQSSKLAFRLNADLLHRLSDEEYVVSEAVIQARMRQEQKRGTTRNGPPLFASRRIYPPPSEAPALKGTVPLLTPSDRRPRPDGSSTKPARPQEPGTTLLMRLRMARGTQTQIPFRLTEDFFRDVPQVKSAQNGESHRIRVANVHGRRNTMKLELPETRSFKAPMARFERTMEGIFYEVYDLGTPQGNQIMAVLKEGRKDNTTQRSINDEEVATWWRYI